MTRVLTINPGSTSTKIEVFDDEASVAASVVRHSAAELAAYERVADQTHWRLGLALTALADAGVPLGSLDAVAARGGLCAPIPGGTYAVDDALVNQLADATHGEHASNLGALLADAIGRAQGIPAFIADPVVVDELDAVARFSGHPEIERRSVFHALNHKAIARRHAAAVGRSYDDLDLVVAHLGGGTSVAAHRHGRVVDVNNALDGDGPLAPERAGGLPTAAWAHLVVAGGRDADELRRMLTGGGGLVSLLGTSDLAEVEARVDAGDGRALLVRDALAHQVAKEIGSCAAALCGRVDAILLTGGAAHDEAVVAAITARVSWIAEVAVYPGEDEAAALRDAALRVLRGEDAAKSYAEVVGDDHHA